MEKIRLCLGLTRDFSLDYVEQVRTLASIGFEGFFYGWGSREEAQTLCRVGKEEGLLFQSIHAPFKYICDLWEETERTPQVIREQIDCLRACAECGVPIMVAHTFIGFEKHTPTPQGLDHFEQIVREAEKLGVKIAFENTEGEEYLAALMAHFKGNAAVGFCWDSGHEMCYNHSKDMLALYGDRLIATHLNDNLGIRDFDGKITWLDDLHLLPFDGIGSWQDIASRLNRCGYEGPLTFELKRVSKPGRHDNDRYAQMTPVDYLTLAYARACRVAALKRSLGSF
ncbi:MAG: sugar phosphate isomerase/epimerase [Clostridia bacterium]|nr:sugar phosphate isomerase/epimerase [Clostridia bacterium]